MKSFQIVLLLIGSLLIVGSQADDCWNFITGSRCDNEDFWASWPFNYPRCNDNCKNNGRSGGRCTRNTENCAGLGRTVNVCKCY